MKKLIVIMVMATMLMGCTGTETEESNDTVVEQTYEMGKAWTEIEAGLEGTEDELAEEFLNWMITAYANADWDVLQNTLDSFDAELFGSSAAVISQFRTAYNNDAPAKVEASGFTTYSNDETGETTGWSMILAETSSEGEYEEMVIYGYHQNDEWTWSMLPITQKIENEEFMEKYEQNTEEYEQTKKEIEEATEAFMKEYEETQTHIQQEMEKFN